MCLLVLWNIPCKMPWKLICYNLWLLFNFLVLSSCWFVCSGLTNPMLGIGTMGLSLHPLQMPLLHWCLWCHLQSGVEMFSKCQVRVGVCCHDRSHLHPGQNSSGSGGWQSWNCMRRSIESCQTLGYEPGWQSSSYQEDDRIIRNKQFLHTSIPVLHL